MKTTNSYINETNLQYLCTDPYLKSTLWPQTDPPPPRPLAVLVDGGIELRQRGVVHHLEPLPRQRQCRLLQLRVLLLRQVHDGLVHHRGDRAVGLGLLDRVLAHHAREPHAVSVHVPPAR